MKEKSNLMRLGLMLAGVIAVGVGCFFVVNHLPNIVNWFNRILRVLSPFVYGIVFAYLLSPMCRWYESHLTRLFQKVGKGKWEKPRMTFALSVVLSYISAFLVLYVLVLLIIPQLCTSVIGIVNEVSGQLNKLNNINESIHTLLADQPMVQQAWDAISGYAVNELQNWLKNDLLPTAQSLLSGIGKQMAGVFSTVKNIVIGLVVSIYLLCGYRKFLSQANVVLYAILPEKWAGLIKKELKYADKMFSGFLSGKLLDSAIIGFICFIGCSIMGFESALLISVIVGVTNIIPFFGPFIGAVPCAMLLLLSNPMHCLYFIIFILVLQQVDGNFIGPMILGDSTGLSSFWVMFAILLFGGLWGFVGMIVGVPLFAVIYDVARQLIVYLLNRRGKQEMLLPAETPPPAEEKTE